MIIKVPSKFVENVLYSMDLISYLIENMVTLTIIEHFYKDVRVVLILINILKK